MMTQNISYKNYLTSKWWLIVIATVISTIISSFYIYLGWEIYLTILAGAVYNIGINSHLVLYAGAYTKTPIDLTSSKGAFGDKKAFNLQTALISLPKIVLPVLLYALGKYLEGPNTGLALVAGAGLIGFALRDRVFSQIEKVYKAEKYKTIQAYKQNN
jgi:multisubunit Na+/H+ antiporter MnhC subunit